MSSLASLGWTPPFQAAFNHLDAPDLKPARVASEERGAYLLFAEAGSVRAQVSGKLRHAAASPAAFPAVGDWVAYAPVNGGDEGIIQAVLPRRSAFSRQGAGAAASEQLVAANLDTVFLVMALNQDFNLRRLERYLVLAWESGAEPVVLLTKADLCSALAEREREVEAIAGVVPVHVTSSVTGDGVDALRALIPPGRTAGLLGSSGAGKSTLVNRLVGHDLLATGAIREDDGRGRHTTTRRELLRVPEGGLILDTPGMRALGLWDAEGGLGAAFDDVEALARACRFADCLHDREPGCAVRAALDDGALAPERLQSYQKLQRELAHQARRQDEHLQRQERQKHKQLSMEIKRYYRQGH